MDTIYRSIVVNKQKAIAGFILLWVGTYLAQYGFDIQTLTVKEFIEQLVYGVIGYIGVYAKANK